MLRLAGALLTVDGDRDLAADVSRFELADGERRVLERVGGVDAGDELAGLDETGEAVVVAAALLGDQEGEALPEEDRQQHAPQLASHAGDHAGVLAPDEHGGS